MRRLGWLLWTLLFIASTGYGASFDCRKAKSAVEKAICGDPEMSRLDEAMGKAYEAASGRGSQARDLRTNQADWLKERETLCGGDKNCLTQLYKGRIATLHHWATCVELRGVIEARRAHRPDSFALKYEDTGGGGSEYRDLDIDSDGIADKVIRGCGSRDSPCDLYIELSGGGKLELLDQGRFYLGRYQSKVYAVFGDSITAPPQEKRGKRSIYEITSKEIRLVCGKI